MAAKPKSSDKFHVGQIVALVLDRSTGHEQYNNRLTTVTAPRVWGEWQCSDPLRKDRGPEVYEGWRYAVVHPDDRSRWNVSEDMLRAIYDGEELSTWTKFAKLTGLRLDKGLVALPIERRPAKRRTRESEGRHGQP